MEMEDAIVEDGENEYEPVGPKVVEPGDNSSWSNFLDPMAILSMNPWLIFLLAGVAYYVYQNYISKIQFPTREGPVTPMDEAKVRDMMEVRNRQQVSYMNFKNQFHEIFYYFVNQYFFQQLYDAAAKELDEKRKQEPPPKVGPISKQIAAKAKLRPGTYSKIELCISSSQ